jgi:hypothetical protein
MMIVEIDHQGSEQCWGRAVPAPGVGPINYRSTDKAFAC